MSGPLPAANGDHAGDGIDERFRALLEATLRQWTSPLERRRMRAFGWRPAVEPGVLKREWRGLAVRVGDAGISARDEDGAELTFGPDDQAVLRDGAPLAGDPAGVAMVERLLDLIGAYERWVEAREGREERIGRVRPTLTDPRPMNALAETRRLQRLLHQPRGRGR